MALKNFRRYATMLTVSYDIKDDKLRTKFYKFIKRYGYRMQYSVYRIDNSRRYLNLIKARIKEEFEPKFTEDDSILIFDIDEKKDVMKFGHAVHEDSELIILE